MSSVQSGRYQQSFGGWDLQVFILLCRSMCTHTHAHGQVHICGEVCVLFVERGQSLPPPQLLNSLCCLYMATLSEAYRRLPLHLRHIIPIDFQSVKHVPDSHSWPSSDDSLLTRVQLPENGEKASLPVIDLGDPSAVNLLGQACEEWGMFQVTNHGIPSSLLWDVESETRRFFSLPAKEKMKALRSPGGAAGYGVARITPFFDKFMWHEGFTILGSPVEHTREVWPHGSQRFW